ncbi:hypothetical protein TcasGA2_TC032590 [Tribolium castaneum]|uniref:Uncharacterized protein n=1 Tax=Tribolium castaneum TaxID=7070 RepID=A0A139WKK5_TRICA|nr:hypothetical protein TcasGA2_TC032590 [Tribolium castaneum]
MKAERRHLSVFEVGEGQLIYSEDEKTFRQRPYHAEYTSSRLITEVKQRRARLVLGWVTAWEHRVPLPPFLF